MQDTITTLLFFNSCRTDTNSFLYKYSQGEMQTYQWVEAIQLENSAEGSAKDHVSI
jgi:hypothetical protein